MFLFPAFAFLVIFKAFGLAMMDRFVFFSFPGLLEGSSKQTSQILVKASQFISYHETLVLARA